MDLCLITADDERDLHALVNNYQPHLQHEVMQLAVLRRKLAEAVIVPSSALSRTVVSMNSVVKVVDLRLREARRLKVVFPADADPDLDHVSVLSPLGAALIGRAIGDIFDCAIPTGTLRFAVKDVLFQPEWDERNRFGATIAGN